MKVDKLQLTNFRNLEANVISFGDGINCIFGDNGNGKTNILEGLYYLVNKKSFRKNTSFPQLISLDCEEPEILFLSSFKSEEEELSYSGKLQSNGSQWYLNGKPTKKRIDIGLIFINPFDSQQFHTSASFRRNWIDHYLSQYNQQYKKQLAKNTKLLRHRNTLLSKKPADFQGQVKAIDYEMAQLAVYITNERKDFLNNINQYLKSTFFELFSSEHELFIDLDSKLINKNEAFYLDFMSQNREKDTIIGRTSYGVHLDDYVLLFDGLNSYDYCSLGQQKMSYLSLLFAYTELFRYKFISYPIVLIDDVSGELDSFRWQRLIDYLKAKNFQVLITTANDNFKDGLDTIDGAVNIQVTSGVIQNI